ncbi:MAG: hypothetical protein PUI48_08250 [Oscillospiraceae bacterium]|nr:hypothetical protein [Oscillospiraceae bacterium]MDY3793207.1 hypothetical protein [Oscillospiraceae bacterium]MDY6209166.1 hypothetical protein [Oscillospiraceae bacterium]
MPYDNEHDTAKLLRECDAGIKMGITSLEDVIPQTADPGLEQVLKQSRQEHIRLRAEAERQLNRIKDKGKSPGAMAKSMSSIKTQLTMQTGGDSDAARLVTNGCEKGISTLNKYLDKYHYADEKSKRLTNELIAAEQKLVSELDRFKG